MSKDELDWDEHDRTMSQVFTDRMRAAIDERDRRLSEMCERLSEKHNISDRQAFRRLLSQLYSLRLEPSSPDFDAWAIPKDLPSWKDVRGTLVSFANDLHSATIRLGQILDEPVLSAALVRCAENHDLGKLSQALHDLLDVATTAASIRGKQGNRPLPEWQTQATALCRDYWRNHEGGDLAPYFNAAKRPKAGEQIRSSTPAGDNRSSNWFCEVMAEIDPAITVSQCNTLLRQM